MLLYPDKNIRSVCISVLLFLTISTLSLSCNKAVVNFGEESLTDDPNIVYLDTMTVNMSTYQADSFITSGDTLFITGMHADSLLGKYEATAFMQIGIPATNNLNGCTNCIFDSLVFETRFTGSYMGDTTDAFTLQVHQMTEQMIADETSIGYNTSTFSYSGTPLGTTVIAQPRPTAKGSVHVKLDPQLGETLFSMLKRDSDTMKSPSLFFSYFHGIAVTGLTAEQKSIYYFGPDTTGSNIVIKLYYRQNGVTAQQGTINFPISPSTFQFNAFHYDRTGTPLSAFTPATRQVLPASLTGNKTYLHSHGGLFPYFSIPSLFAIKELYPYIKVVKAELVITPDLSNYASSSGYFLPPALALRKIDDNNNIGSIFYDASGSMVQTGNLAVDDLYHLNTTYTYDLTSYVNTILSNGILSQQSFLLMPFSETYENRLVLYDLPGKKSVKLKLYVLGL